MRGPRHQTASPGRAFYVSAISGRKRRMIAGPFVTFSQAYGLTNTIRHLVADTYRDGWDVAIGTAQGPDDLPTVYGRDGWKVA